MRQNAYKKEQSPSRTAVRPKQRVGGNKTKPRRGPSGGKRKRGNQGRKGAAISTELLQEGEGKAPECCR